MPRLSKWIQWVSFVLAVALLGGACGGNSQFTPLTADSPLAQSAQGLTVSVNPAALSSGFGVQISARSAEQAEAAWGKALPTLPANLHLQSPIFEIKTTGTPPEQMFLSVILPAQADPATFDLYAWDGKQWGFLPAHALGGQLVANVSTAPEALALFEAAPIPPFAFAVVEPGQTLTPQATEAINVVLLGGVGIKADGTLGGQLPAVPLDQAYAVYPLVRTYEAASGTAELEPEALANLLTSPDARSNHLQELISLALSNNFKGLALDYRGLGSDLKLPFASFANDLAAQLHAHNKALLVQVAAPTPSGEGFTTGGYDWAALSAAADAVLLPAPADPAAFGNGDADRLLAWAVGETSASHLRLVTSALSVDKANETFKPISYDSALAPLGSATLAPEAQAAQSGQAITVTLSGQAKTLDYDPAAFAARYEYSDDSGTAHTVWLTTASTLRARLSLAEKYRLGGVVVTDLLATGLPADLPSAITQYKIQAAAAVDPQVALLWTVSDSSGVLAQATAQPGQPYVYVAPAPGEYQIAAALQNGTSVELGSVGVRVAETLSTPTAVAGASQTGSTGGGSGSGSGLVGGGGGGGFVPPPPITTGSFELGGQVPGFIGHSTQMKQAGMTWVKFQATGDAGGFIAAGHGAGFKVLLSAVGDHARAADPAYWPEYAAWVAGMAAQGADAIEVWNEANIDREWPTGKISGATYTELLKQAYNAIKGANSSTLVISGAPAPTGAEAAFPGRVVNDNNFLGQMASAGAASYMDCVGVHYNEGILSPTQSSGDPRDSFYSRYYSSMVDLYYGTFGGSRQLCFTELGYLTGEGYGPIPDFFAWAANTTVAQQAQWLAEAASLSGSSGKVRLMTIFNVDFTLWGADPQGGYAILRPDGSCPACAALDAVMP